MRFINPLCEPFHHFILILQKFTTQLFLLLYFHPNSTRYVWKRGRRVEGWNSIDCSLSFWHSKNVKCLFPAHRRLKIFLFFFIPNLVCCCWCLCRRCLRCFVYVSRHKKAIRFPFLLLLTSRWDQRKFTLKKWWENKWKSQQIDLRLNWLNEFSSIVFCSLLDDDINFFFLLGNKFKYRGEKRKFLVDEKNLSE
jgi:hypothetical protein